jgi:hypothetical protein
MHLVGVRVSEDLLKIVAASGMRGENDALRTKAGDAQALLYLSEGEIDEFLKTAGSATQSSTTRNTSWLTTDPH